MHHPVLYHEIIHVLRPRGGGHYVDGTVGAGGHAWGILHSSQPDGMLLGMDIDPQALELAKNRLAEFGDRVKLVRASYISLPEQIARLGWVAVDGIVLDLGLSSMQLDTQERGFSFLADAPLDMRFDPENPVRAMDLVNNLSVGELADILYQYGEERRARQVSRLIVESRPIYTTRQLADIVSRGTSSGRKGLHPATRTFQALRIAVNQELDALEAVLPQAVASLTPGGRLAIIAFHSLEDRIVKRYFQRESRDCLCPPRQPKCTCGHHAQIQLVHRRPIRPQASEVDKNPRARSARLRVAEKLQLDIG